MRRFSSRKPASRDSRRGSRRSAAWRGGATTGRWCSTWCAPSSTSYKRDPDFERLMLYAALEGHELATTSRAAVRRAGLRPAPRLCRPAPAGRRLSRRRPGVARLRARRAAGVLLDGASAARHAAGERVRPGRGRPVHADRARRRARARGRSRGPRATERSAAVKPRDGRRSPSASTTKTQSETRSVHTESWNDDRRCADRDRHGRLRRWRGGGCRRLARSSTGAGRRRRRDRGRRRA